MASYLVYGTTFVRVLRHVSSLTRLTGPWSQLWPDTCPKLKQKAKNKTEIIMFPRGYKFTGFGDLHGPKPYKFIGIGDLHGPKPYKFTGLGD